MNLATALKMFFPLPEVHAFIKKQGDKHCVKFHSGKNMGCYDSPEGAKKRLKQVEYFKHVKAQNEGTFYGPNTDMGPSVALDPE